MCFTTCNISLINVLKENLTNELNLKYNNNNYPGVECFGKVTGLDKVNDVYIVSIGTNSNITFLLQFAIWGLMFLLAPGFKFNYKKIRLYYVSLLSLFFTFQQFGEERFYSQVNKYFDLSISANNYYLISIFFSFWAVKVSKGSHRILNPAAICIAVNIIVSTLFGSILINFQGSWSAKYLFPNLARFITS